jgi:hypothetical protein
MRCVVVGLGVLAAIVVGARIYSHGPIASDYIVFIELPEIIEEAASEVGARVTYAGTAVPDTVPLEPSFKIKLHLKKAFSAIALEKTQDEYAEAYSITHSETKLSLKCIFRGLGDQVIGIALEPAGKEPAFLLQFKSALQRRLPAYAISSLPSNKSLERTREG